MLRINTSGICPKCGQATLLYEDGKFTCSKCDKKYTSKEITKTNGDAFEIMVDITEEEFRAKIKELDGLCMRFSASYIGCDTKSGVLYYGWDNGYPVRLNMLVQELNEILN